MDLPDIKSSMRIDVYSHGFKVSGFDYMGKKALLDFCRGLAQYGLVKVGRNQFDRQMLRVFAATTKERTEFRFHRHQYQDFLYHLAAYGIPHKYLDIHEWPMYEPEAVEFKLKDTRPPREKQVPIIEYMNAPGATKVTTLQTGGGKAQPLDAAIKIPGGWTTMGDVKVNDLVTSRDGSATRVTAVYPQGEKEIYRVTFADGRSTECCAEHLWKVFYINTVPHRRWRVVDTTEMMRLLAMPNPRVYIDLAEPEVDQNVELPLDPYLLGALLGDGHTGHKAIHFSSADQFLLDEVARLLPASLEMKHRGAYDYQISGAKGSESNPIVDLLREMELAGCRSWEKFIPEVYLTAGREQRLALLQGLMDTDGTVGRDNGTVSFCTTSLDLAVHTQYLVRSLGGIASISPKQTVFTYKGDRKNGRVAYIVSIRYKKPSELFRLPRKKERTNDENQYSADLKLRVMSVEYVGRKQAQCIAVEHPEHLYVTDGFVVTHNTFIGLRTTSMIGQRTALVLKGMYVEKWIPDVEGHLDLKKGDLMVVRGADHLAALMHLAIAGELKAKFIIITSKTMFNYMKTYEALNGVMDEIFPIPPDKFYETIRAGVRIIDEVHQDFHCNFRQDLYTHIPKTISLSATLDSDDQFMNRMYEIVFPQHLRAPEQEYHRFIEMIGLEYSINDIKRVRLKGGSGQYSHAEVEKSLMRNKQMLQNYFDMITAIAYKEFISVFEKGQSMLIQFSLKEMCTQFVAHLKRKYPHLEVNRYIDEDDYEENFMKGDIVVSTIGSSGTAVDRPNLRVTFMTVALSSKQSNIQVLGRTRPLKDWPDVTPKFLFLSCREIPKHREYTEGKLEKLDGKVLSSKVMQTGFRV